MERCSKASRTTILRSNAMMTQVFCHQKPRSILLEWVVNILTRSALSSQSVVLAYFSQLWRARWMKYLRIAMFKNQLQMSITSTVDTFSHEFSLISTPRRGQEL